jgi:hypothetical protein
MVVRAGGARLAWAIGDAGCVEKLHERLISSLAGQKNRAQLRGSSTAPRSPRPSIGLFSTRAHDPSGH